MALANKCKIKDRLVNRLIALNNKLNTLSPALLRGEQARAEVQELRQELYVDIKAPQGERTQRQTLSCH